MNTERAPITLTLTPEQADAVWETLLDARDCQFESLREDEYETEAERRESAEWCALLDGAMAALRAHPEEAVTADEYLELAREA